MSRVWHRPVRAFSVAMLLIGVPAVRAGDIEAPPIRYSKTPAQDRAARLEEQLQKGQASLKYEEGFGYLRSVLQALDVSPSSQMLVYSKTSFQRHRIGPETPRALYFNDDVYVGYCHAGDVLEITTVDPQLGAVFYIVDQKPGRRAEFRRQEDTCLICHASSQNQGFPGHLARSLFVERDGLPILSSGSQRVDHTTPLAERWGGWYVTGTSGKQRHRGNLVIGDRTQTPEQIDNAAGLNVTDLWGRFHVADYVTPHSDLVALLVFEHQAETQNRMTRANCLIRMALHEQAEMNRIVGRPADYRSESIDHRIRNACEPLVRHLLLSGEAALTEPVRGTSSFAEEFPRRGPRDGQGRSLRDLDLQTRLFRYPCSYLIYTAQFDGLPPEAKEQVYRRLWEVLTGADASREYAHLSAADRRAVLDILRTTKPDLPGYWREVSPAR